MPTCRAMASAVRRLSPVIMATLMPRRCSSATALAEVSFRVSATATTPAALPSTATNIAVLPSCSNRSASATKRSSVTFRSAISLRLPSRMIRPSCCASTPWPGIASNRVASSSVIPRALAPLTMASPSGCSEFFSATAARRSTSASSPLAATTSVTEGCPLVSVPVLSKTTTCTLLVASMASAPLKRMPYSAPLPLPAMMAVGVASPTAHGQEMTSTVTETRKAKPKALTVVRV